MRLFRRWRGGIFSRGDQFTARDGRTALMCACAKGDIEWAQLLVEEGADVNMGAKEWSSFSSCVSCDAVASDPDSASCWAWADPQSRVSFGIG